MFKRACLYVKADALRESAWTLAPTIGDQEDEATHDSRPFKAGSMSDQRRLQSNSSRGPEYQATPTTDCDPCESPREGNGRTTTSGIRTYRSLNNGTTPTDEKDWSGWTPMETQARKAGGCFTTLLGTLTGDRESRKAFVQEPWQASTSVP